MKRGFSEDDWLDDIKPRSRTHAAKKSVQKPARVLRPDESNGTVTELFPNQSAVRLDGAARPVLCNYRMATLAFGTATRERSPVCVGDRVRVEGDIIVGRCERRNRLIRPAPNTRDPILHVLAANVDCLVVVASAHEPDFSSGIVDRFLVAASAQKIEQVLCLNKTDLVERGEERPWSYYHDTGVEVVETSARAGDGIERLAALIRGQVSVFCGHSGVGKTSLLRRLLKDENYGRVGAVSAPTGQGRHTTSGAVLLPGPDGSSYIDTPGILNFGLIDVTPAGLLCYFPELESAATHCPPNCTHDDEPACALQDLPRFDSFHEIRHSLG